MSSPSYHKLQRGSAPTSAFCATRNAKDNLRHFCEGILALKSNDNAQGSVLTSILPSLFHVLYQCRDQTILVCEELRAWEQRSQGLLQLANLHGADDAENIRHCLDRIGSQAALAGKNLEAFRSAAREPGAAAQLREVLDAAFQSPLNSEQKIPLNSAETHLQSFCAAAVDLLRAGADNRSVLSQAVPSVLQAFTGCDSNAIAALRDELRASEEFEAPLIQLATTHCGSAAGSLQRRVQQAHAAAARVVDALEWLQLVWEGGHRRLRIQARGTVSLRLHQTNRCLEQEVSRAAPASFIRWRFVVINSRNWKLPNGFIPKRYGSTSVTR